MHTQWRILNLVTNGANTPLGVLSGLTCGINAFNYWRHGELLDELAGCELPAIRGLTHGPFTLEMHTNTEHHRGYMRSSLSLSEFGRALLANETDFARFNTID